MHTQWAFEYFIHACKVPGWDSCLYFLQTMFNPWKRRSEYWRKNVKTWTNNMKIHLKFMESYLYLLWNHPVVIKILRLPTTLPLDKTVRETCWQICLKYDKFPKRELYFCWRKIMKTVFGSSFCIHVDHSVHAFLLHGRTFHVRKPPFVALEGQYNFLLKTVCWFVLYSGIYTQVLKYQGYVCEIIDIF